MTDQRENHIGSSFDDFLEEEGIKADVEIVALNRVIAWQLRRSLRLRRTKPIEHA